jgi:hypothetical protein
MPRQANEIERLTVIFLDRPAVLMHFIEDLSADEARALEEAYRRLTGQRRSAARASRRSRP